MILYHNYGKNLRDNKERFSFRWSLLESHSCYPIQSRWHYSPLSESPEKAHLYSRIKKDREYCRISEGLAHDRKERTIQSAQKS